MNRKFPNEILSILEFWFNVSITCVKILLSGVRQGGVLSPVLFSISIDDLIRKVTKVNVGCYLSSICVFLGLIC